MRTLCPKCLVEQLVNWWLEYDGAHDDQFEEVEVAIEYLDNAMAACFIRPADLCDIHLEEQEERVDPEQGVAAHG